MDIQLSKLDFAQYILYNYYSQEKLLKKIIRIGLGPTIILFGLNLLSENDPFQYVYAFAIAIGVIYTLRPFALIILPPYGTVNLHFELKGNELFIKDHLAEANVTLNSENLTSNKKYFFVTLENKQVIYFPKNKLSQEYRFSFNNILHKVD
jgi:hypothetical protein